MSAKSSNLSKIVTFVGAGIVLATFVVKDVMNEKMKDVNDSLNTAQMFYFTQTYSIFGQDDHAYITQEIDLALNAILNAKDQFASSEQIISVRAQASDNHLGVLTEYLQNLSQLIDKIPQEKGRADQVRKLNSQCEQNYAAIRLVQGEIAGVFGALKKNKKDPKAIAQLSVFVDQTGAIFNNTKTITAGAKTLTGEVVADLGAKKQESERKFALTTTLSYVLFGLGWVTSLVGQLLGIGGQSES
jgi:hypothetical protein